MEAWEEHEAASISREDGSGEKALAAWRLKYNSWSLHMEGESHSHKMFSDFQIHAMTLIHMHTQNQTH